MFFHFRTYIHHFILIPETFAKISQISHDNDVMYLTRFPGCLIQRTKHRNITVQRIFGYLNQIFHFTEHWHTEHKERCSNSGCLYTRQLFYTGRSQKLAPAICHSLRYRNHTCCPLDNPSHTDATGRTGIYYLTCIMS